MKSLDRITFDPSVMGGKACVRGMRVTAGTVIGLLAAGRSREEILLAYPYLEEEDIDQCLAYAAWRLEEREVPHSAGPFDYLSESGFTGFEDYQDFDAVTWTGFNPVHPFIL